MSTSLVPIDHPSQLAKLGQAQQMLAECRTLSEVKKIQNYALAYKVYAKAAHLGREIQNSVAEIVLLASRRAGEILNQLEKTPKQKAAKKSTDTVTGDSEYRKTLNETETDERTAERWQKLAAIPQPTVDNYISAAREKKQAITAAGLLKLAPPKERPAPKPTEVRNLREWMKAECPGLDAVIQSHVKYGEESMNFDLEFRDITSDEVKLICKSLRELRSKGKAAA